MTGTRTSAVKNLNSVAAIANIDANRRPIWSVISRAFICVWRAITWKNLRTAVTWEILQRKNAKKQNLQRAVKWQNLQYALHISQLPLYITINFRYMNYSRLWRLTSNLEVCQMADNFCLLRLLIWIIFSLVRFWYIEKIQ